jgi:hypothetical protein
MPVANSLTWVLAALAVALAALAAGAIMHQIPLSVAGAALFAATIIASGASAGRTARYVDDSSGSHLTTNAALGVARHHTLLAALAYGWAAAGFAAVYSLSDLVWYHAYQYGIGAFLGACGLYYFYRRMGASNGAAPPAIGLTALHAAVAAGGLAYLAASGKLMSQRTDWPGNVIFTAGGIAIVALCIIAINAQIKLGKSGA